MNKALIIIDYVYDFVAEDGKLTCGTPGQAIDGYLAARVDEFANDGQLIVTAADVHAAGDAHHPESKLFPPHCLAGSTGREVFGETRRAVENAPASQLLILDKTRYSAFAGTVLDQKLRERGIKDIYLTGVCSDICVLHTAVDAYNLGYNIFIYANAVASFNAAGHEFALAHFKQTLGATIL